MAIRHLGNMRRTEASDALTSIYGSDTNVEVRKAIVSALYNQNNAKALVDIARAEKNPEMKKDIVSKLSNMKSKEATDYLLELLNK
jgi:HEAT repeat protein